MIVTVTTKKNHPNINNTKGLGLPPKKRRVWFITKSKTGFVYLNTNNHHLNPFTHHHTLRHHPNVTKLTSPNQTEKGVLYNLNSILPLQYLVTEHLKAAKLP